jgi:hypothetical protein
MNNNFDNFFYGYILIFLYIFISVESIYNYYLQTIISLKNPYGIAILTSIFNSIYIKYFTL